ncbi:hypothetical protein DWG20_03910 [Crenobacter cavernae]|uniref:DUF4398 domain-containing protein n=2 Tax=Crenobacter cavernae TaxID=2290923 RepID=A0A345Y3Y7_9NEIS|nr:hypothetical protein DWG20_03910 [Crenobacter cavernae]
MITGLLASSLLSLPALCAAQTIDEALLAAQMAYQQADGQSGQSALRLKSAESALTQAQQRLADAQNAVTRAESELSAAKSAEEVARRRLAASADSLKSAWARKERTN